MSNILYHAKRVISVCFWSFLALAAYIGIVVMIG